MESATMAPSRVGAAAQPHRSSSPEGQDEPSSAQKKAAVRKRTKTGCLTCRKRRIKCDEGRPTCNNCLKSKRQCEGYNQRVIFKDPLGAFAGVPYGPIQYPTPSPLALVREQQLTAAQQRPSAHALQIIAPKPPTLGYHHAAEDHFGQFFSNDTVPLSHHPPLDFGSNRFGPQQPPSRYTFFPPTTVDAFMEAQWRQEPLKETTYYTPVVTEEALPVQSISPLVTQPPRNFHGSKLDASAEMDLSPHTANLPIEEWEYPKMGDNRSTAESEDESNLVQQGSQLSLEEMGVIARRMDQSHLLFGTHTRISSVYGADNLLTTYDPSPFNSPVNDKQIAAVFWHFINVTGPSMSLFERHPVDPEPIFQGQPVPRSRQHIWTYLCPIQSLRHPALLQAILAIGSLQIAKLQGVPPTASLKHYHLALRRIAKNVTRPARRAQATNLAATLLLAFYEVWNSDHDKWSRHLLGARWIIKEIPLAEMTSAIMGMKRRQRRREMEQSHMEAFGHFVPSEEPGPLYKDWDMIDVQFLSSITGRQLSYEDFGMLPEEMGSHGRSSNIYTERDMEKYEQLSDLFWWYCKMDVYQSILGGTRPFMEYEKWTQCPPRAPLGRLDATYGTYDHLMLLLGRLANFASRDLGRKREVIRAKDGINTNQGGGGGGGPPAGMFPGILPTSGKVSLPMGFSPPREDSLKGEKQQQQQQQPPPPPDDAKLGTRTVEASREWEEIREGFDVFRRQLGRDFEPLATTADVRLGPGRGPGPGTTATATATPTPFGPAARYRTHAIAGIWMNYCMGLIVLHRAHPTMPPVAMLAAGLSARTTLPYALAVGRIAAGLEQDDNVAPGLGGGSTTMGGALIECAFPLFVAGIQYQTDDQRHWLVRRMHDTARLTGWQSAHQIADGCQSAWAKAAQYGRGPPWHPRPPPSSSDVSVGGVGVGVLGSGGGVLGPSDGGGGGGASVDAAAAAAASSSISSPFSSSYPYAYAHPSSSSHAHHHLHHHAHHPHHPHHPYSSSSPLLSSYCPPLPSSPSPSAAAAAASSSSSSTAVVTWGSGGGSGSGGTGVDDIFVGVNSRRIDRRFRAEERPQQPGGNPGDGGGDDDDYATTGTGTGTGTGMGTGMDGSNNNNNNNWERNKKKKKIVLAKAEKAFYAMGLLAVEHDLERLDLDEAERRSR
ncbi:hypothetical protein GGR56DRAFT_689771 [Xylariaceae sp. FL0804]|nr:hypothetical protein GGR56DRAFT_689771 [Xylariaceae sp. FL0804]